MDYLQTGKKLLALVGDEENVSSLLNCATRLRFTLKDYSKVQEEEIKKTPGVLGAVRSGAQYQIIIGPEVGKVTEAIYSISNLREVSQKSSKPESVPTNDAKKGNPLINAIAVIPAVFGPFMPVLVACGMLAALFSVLTTFHLIDTDSTTYAIFNYVSQMELYFLPFFVAAGAAKRFNFNYWLAMVVPAMLMHPTLLGMVTAGDPVTLFGLPVALVNYSSSLLPALLGVWIMSYIYKFFDKHIPSFIKFLAVPTLTLLVMVPIMLVAIGPLGSYLGNGVSAVLLAIDNVMGWLTPAIVAAIKPLLVTTGMHYALSAAFLQQFASTGMDTFYSSATICANMAQAGAAFGVALRTKKPELKQMGFSTSFTALMGITEPAMFGVTLRYRTPFVAAMIAAGLGGLYAGISHVVYVGLAGVSVFGILGADTACFINMGIAMAITLIISTVLSYIMYRDEN